MFVYDDGLGNAVDESGRHVLDMEIDEENYPLDSVTNYDQYLREKPSERPKNTANEANKQSSMTMKNETTTQRRTYSHYTDKEKEQFFFLVYERDMTAGKAAAKLGIARRTAYNWLQNDQRNPADEIVPKQSKKAGRPRLLNDAHKDHIISFVDENPSAPLDEMMASLTQQFEGLHVSNSTLHKFVTEKCQLSFKKAHLHSKKRNDPETLQARYAWAMYWKESNMCFIRNCVFVDESAFHINLKRTMAWSKKGTRAEVIVPQTRAKTTTILGAISSYGIINMKVRRPQVASKKRKTAGSSTVKATTGTVTGHYFNFISSTMDVLDRHPNMKGSYIVMDNAPIHTASDIAKLIENRGYQCVYLPPYSPELNPIEQFWSVCKSKLKREKLLEEETLTSRIADACNHVLISDFEGFCRYSSARIDDCLKKIPL